MQQYDLGLRGIARTHFRNEAAHHERPNRLRGRAIARALRAQCGADGQLRHTFQVGLPPARYLGSAYDPRRHRSGWIAERLS